MSDGRGEEAQLSVGMRGISTDDIETQRHGSAYFPVGPMNPETGQRQWTRRRVRALEYIPGQRRVLVVDENRGIRIDMTNIEWVHLRTSLFNRPIVAAADILPEPVVGRAEIEGFLVHWTFDTNGNLTMTRTKNGVTITELLGAVTASTPDEDYIYVTAGDIINFQHSAGGRILNLIIVESVI